MKFFTQYERPPEEFEKGGGESLVETTGYVEANILIENMIYAGMRLDYSRSEMYDFPPGTEDDPDFSDPLRKPGLDPAEVSQLVTGVNARLSEQRKLFEEEKKAREEDEKKQYQLFKEEQEKKKAEVKKGE